MWNPRLSLGTRTCKHAKFWYRIYSPMLCPCGTADSDATINNSVQNISSAVQNAGGLNPAPYTTVILRLVPPLVVQLAARCCKLQAR